MTGGTNFMRLHSMRLRGGQVQLDPLEELHRDRLRAAADDARIWEHTLMVARGASFDPWFNDVLTKRNAGRQIPFAVHHLATGQLVGSTSYLDITPEHRRIEIGSTWYNPEVWGSGVNRECKLLLLTYAFETLGMNRVAFVTDSRNERSLAAITSLGAIREGVCRAHMISQGGRVRDSVMFSIIAAEWAEAKQRLEERLAATER
jgi:RimJ/RimL family protein N-acetyltransferase